MYYIQRSTRKNRSKVTISHLGPALVVFVCFLGLTVWSWYDTNRNLQRDAYQLLQQDIDRASASIALRLKTHDDMLNAGVSLLASSPGEVNRSDWSSFVSRLNLPERYSGVQGLGYSVLLSPSAKDAHVNAVRASGLSDYVIYPAGNRSIYSSILFLEPQNDRNQKALGYDMYSEPVRREAMDTAASTKQTTMSEPVTLVQEDVGSNQPGFLMYAPFFAATNAQEPEGYVYAPFRAQNFITQAISTSNQPNIAYRITTNAAAREAVLFESESYASITQKPSAQSYTTPVGLYGQTWQISGVVSQDILTPRERERPAGVLWGGTLFSVFVAGFIYLLLVNRARRIVETEQAEVQTAKDELLALASHQLRTPATGVKQYIGMLREGYAGVLTDEQLGLLDKAHASNERQLGTINEMLVVAKADTGHLDLNKEPVDINQMIRDIVDEADSYIKARNHVFELYLAETPVYCFGDQAYLRMALENIASNANKYTPDGGTITITVLRRKTYVHIIIRDTGVGVAKKDFPMLFEKFARIPNELTRKVGGSGIGLYLAKKIINEHGGDISFESVVDQGSVCTVKLPLMQEPKPINKASRRKTVKNFTGNKS
jgi:signal transduction histidine kinase